jgi:glyoxylase-like metal-dependent hydrolase (beta-lactamase superfamily II)
VAPDATIHHLSCGSFCPYGARLLQGSGGWLSPARMVCHCLVVETAEGLVLLDTGFGIGDVENPARLGHAFRLMVRPQLEQRQTAVSQLRALGHEPGDVRRILITHLDLDHAGGLAEFPDAEVHVFAPEHEAAMNPGLRERSRYIADQWAHGPRWVTHEVEGDEWLGFESIRVLDSDPEILLIPLVGHSRGHTGVAIRRADGWLLHCGDAYFHHGQVETPSHCPPGLRLFQNLSQVDGSKRRANEERLRELAQTRGGEVELICSHDPADLERFGA